MFSSAFQLVFLAVNQLITCLGGTCGLISMFSPGGTVDKIFTGGAGKNGATIAVSFPRGSGYGSCMHVVAGAGVKQRSS